MKRTIVIEVEIVSSCFGLSTKFWKGNSVEGQTDLKHTADEMYRLTDYYNRTCGANVVFATRARDAAEM